MHTALPVCLFLNACLVVSPSKTCGPCASATGPCVEVWAVWVAGFMANGKKRERTTERSWRGTHNALDYTNNIRGR